MSDPAGRLVACDMDVAAPAPLGRAVAQNRLDRVRDDVAGNPHDRLVVTAHERGLVARLEEVPLAPVALVEGTGVAAVQPLHPVAEVGIRRLDQQMDVVGHQAVGEQMPALALDDRDQEPRVQLVVLVVDKDATAIDAAGDDVIDAAGDLVP